MTNWIRSLVDPRTMARRARLGLDDVQAPHLFALLTLGDFESFVRIAPRYGYEIPPWLPQFPIRDGAEGATKIPVEHHPLLTEMLQVVAGSTQENPGELEPSELEFDDADAAVVRIIVRSMALVDAQLIDLAERQLVQGLEIGGSEYAQTLLVLQLAVAAELSRFADDSALQRMSDYYATARDSPLPPDEPPIGGTAIDQILRAVTSRGERRCGEMLGTWTFSESDDEYRLRRLLQEEEHGVYADLAESLLKQRFEDRTHSAVQKISVFGGSSDKVNDALARGLLRARCLADASYINRLRRQLARNQAIRSIGSTDTGAGFAALDELMQSNDTDGIKRVGFSFWSAGPLEPLRRVAGATIARVVDQDRISGARPLGRAENELLRHGVDLVDHADAVQLAGHLHRAMRSSDGASQRLDILRLARSLARWRAPGIQEELAAALLVAVEIDDDLYTSGLASRLVVDSISEMKRDALLEWATDGARADSSSTRIELLQQFGQSRDPERVVETLRAQLVRGRDLGVATALWNVGTNADLLSEDDLSLIFDVAAATLTRVRERAHGNSYAYGAGVQPLAILIRLALFANYVRAWTPTVEFLCDPKVSRRDKTEASRMLAASHSNLPNDVKRAIRDRVDAAIGPDWVDQPVDSKLRPGYRVAGIEISSREHFNLAVASDAIEPSQVVALTTDLVASPYDEDKVAAAQMIYYSRSAGQRESMFPLALALARDDEPDVRSSGLRTLCTIRPASGWRSDMIDQALEDAVQTQGVLIPWRVLGGIMDAPKSMSRVTVQRLLGILRNHPSRNVQNAIADIEAAE